jgi:hypothetical protein
LNNASSWNPRAYARAVPADAARRLAAIRGAGDHAGALPRFRHILIFERRGWVDRLVFTLSIGVPIMAGVTAA